MRPHPLCPAETREEVFMSNMDWKREGATSYAAQKRRSTSWQQPRAEGDRAAGNGRTWSESHGSRQWDSDERRMNSRLQFTAATELVLGLNFSVSDTRRRLYQDELAERRVT